MPSVLGLSNGSVEYRGNEQFTVVRFIKACTGPEGSRRIRLTDFKLIGK
jgi:hypothetical protein